MGWDDRRSREARCWGMGVARGARVVERLGLPGARRAAATSLVIIEHCLARRARHPVVPRSMRFVPGRPKWR